MREIKILELFGGISAPRKALERLGYKVDSTYVEIDKFAVKSHNAIWNEEFEPLSVTDFSGIGKKYDLLFHGSPCQDFSIAGKQQGGEKGSGTRSSLMWETVRIIEECMPPIVIWENVKNVIGKNNKPTFDKYLEKMEELGYKNSYQVLNAKDYGIPQNRERVFVVSVLNHDINIKFPTKQKLKVRLKDMLEDNPVDDRYYLSEEMKKYIVAKPSGKYTNSRIEFNREIAKTINCSVGNRRASVDTHLSEDLPNAYKMENIDFDAKIITEAVITEKDRPNGNYLPRERIISEDGVSRAMTTSESQMPFIRIKNATKKGYLEATDGDGIDLAYPTSNTRRGRVQKDKAHTITTSDNLAVLENSRIRKLTPRECWRLMGFDDEDFDKAKMVNSNTQLYKQAGNSIVVNVLEALFKELFKDVKLIKRRTMSNETIKQVVEEKIRHEEETITKYVDSMFEERFKLAKTRPEHALYLGHIGKEKSTQGFAYDEGYDAWISFGLDIFDKIRIIALKDNEEAATELGKDIHKIIIKLYLDQANIGGSLIND